MNSGALNTHTGTNTKTDLVLINLRRIMQAIDLHSRDLSRRYGITAPQLILLREIQRRGSITVGELARSVSLRQTTVTDILNRLEKLGLISRSRNATGDRRQVFIRLAPPGADLMVEAPSPLQERFVDKFENLPAWQQSMALTALELLADLLTDHPLEAAPILTAGTVIDEIHALSPVIEELP